MAMGDTSQPTEIIAKLNGLAEKLGPGHDQNARREAIQLSKDLVASLEKPENIAVDLAFAVRTRPPFGWVAAI